MESSDMLADPEFLRKAEETLYRDFDKLVISLASGALGVSIAFIHDIAPHPHSRWALVTSWVLLPASLLAMLGGYLVAQHSLAELIDWQRTESPNSGKNLDKYEQLHAWTTRINSFSVGTLALGLIFLLIFALLNL